MMENGHRSHVAKFREMNSVQTEVIIQTDEFAWPKRGGRSMLYATVGDDHHVAIHFRAFRRPKTPDAPKMWHDYAVGVLAMGPRDHDVRKLVGGLYVPGD